MEIILFVGLILTVIIWLIGVIGFGTFLLVAFIIVALMGLIHMWKQPIANPTATRDALISKNKKDSEKFKLDLESISQEMGINLTNSKHCIMACSTAKKFTLTKDYLLFWDRDDITAFEREKITAAHNEVSATPIEKNQANEKNVVGRGVAGALLFGTAGAVIGSASALKSNTPIIDNPEDKFYYGTSSVIIVCDGKTFRHDSNFRKMRYSSITDTTRVNQFLQKAMK